MNGFIPGENISYLFRPSKCSIIMDNYLTAFLGVSGTDGMYKTQA